MLRIAFTSSEQDGQALRQTLVKEVAELSHIHRHQFCDQSCSLTSAIKVLPIMTSGIPLVNSRTLFLTQSAAVWLEANASSALSNRLIVISTSGPPSSR